MVLVCTYMCASMAEIFIAKYIEIHEFLDLNSISLDTHSWVWFSVS